MCLLLELKGILCRAWIGWGKAKVVGDEIRDWVWNFEDQASLLSFVMR